MVDQSQINEARRTLGRRLAAFRQAADCGQEEFAALVHYSRSSLANVEIGRQKVTQAFWGQCDALLKTGGVLAAAFGEIQALERRRHQEAAHQSRPHPIPDTEVGQAGIRTRVTRAAHESQAFLANGSPAASVRRQLRSSPRI